MEINNDNTTVTELVEMHLGEMSDEDFGNEHLNMNQMLMEGLYPYHFIELIFSEDVFVISDYAFSMCNNDMDDG
jgi:hypothetical protein